MPHTTLTPDAWDQLLRALDPDVAQAAARYERLRRCLIALYRGRALPDPEHLADQALDGMARSLADPGCDVGTALREVAHRVGDAAHRSHRARGIALAALPAAHGPDDADDPLARLCRCLDELPELDRWSLLAYEGADGDRSRRRQALAAELGIPVNALRVRMHRLRVRLLARLGGARRAASPVVPVAAVAAVAGVVAVQREPVAGRAEALERARPADPHQDDHVGGPPHAEDRPRLEELRAGQGQRARRAAAQRGQHEPQQLAGIGSR